MQLQFLEQINLNRKSKKDFEVESKENPKKIADFEWISVLLNQIQMIGNDGVFKYMKQILEFKGYAPKKIWLKDGDTYIQTLYLAWDMGYMVINSLGVERISTRTFCDNIQAGKYLPNKNRNDTIVY